jgi:F1F0 ATPase subunit 2
MMNETVGLLLVLVTGLVLGAMYFGGLWWTVKKGVSSRHPALLFLGSLLLRTTIALAGFTFIARGHWERLLMCILGFFIARFILTRFAGPPIEHYTSSAKETGHAS